MKRAFYRIEDYFEDAAFSATGDISKRLFAKLSLLAGRIGRMLKELDNVF